MDDVQNLKMFEPLLADLLEGYSFRAKSPLLALFRQAGNPYSLAGPHIVAHFRASRRVTKKLPELTLQRYALQPRGSG
jgi:hypothetical protein